MLTNLDADTDAAFQAAVAKIESQGVTMVEIEMPQLAELNGRVKAAGLPPLSALVTYKPQEGDNFGPPGGGFWGSPGVPPRPARADNRLLVWMGFVNLAHRAAWPASLPGLT